MNMKDFDRACELLPEGVTWGEAITPSIVKHIAEAALAAQVQQESQWISVEERLPEHTNRVLCRAIGLLAPIETIKISSLTPEKTGFYVEYDGIGSAPIEKITHWMPLPPAPVSANEQPEGDKTK